MIGRPSVALKWRKYTKLIVCPSYKFNIDLSMIIATRLSVSWNLCNPIFQFIKALSVIIRFNRIIIKSLYQSSAKLITVTILWVNILIAFSYTFVYWGVNTPRVFKRNTWKLSTIYLQNFKLVSTRFNFQFSKIFIVPLPLNILNCLSIKLILLNC